MPIAFSRYIAITSALGAGSTSPQRELIARLFTTNSDVPTKTVLEFTEDEVSNFFGASSQEARRANSYFGFVSKNGTRPSRISFARWADADTAPLAIGTETDTTLTEFQAVTAGEFTLTLGVITETVSGIDLSSAGDFASVASAVQTVVRAANADALFAQAVVAYDAARSRFTLTGGGTGGDTAIDIQPTAATPVLGDLLGWGAGTVFSRGVDAETIVEVLSESSQLTNNFGSYAFVQTLTEEQVTESATWNDGNNVLYQYHVPVLPADAAAVSANIIGLGGTGMTLMGTQVNEFPEMLPMSVLAATNYARRASVQNYMFQQTGLTPTVITSADADLYDGLRVNYYGQTQTAGQQLSFYQRGFLTGTGTDPVNMNVFANEQWLKDFAGSQIMGLLLALPRVPANATGRGQVLAVLRDPVVETALVNGTISVGRTLSTQQRLFITEQTGDPNAFQQVQTSGYWLDATIESRTVNGVLEFFVAYTLIYSKDDVIRRVEGSHVLI